MLHILSSSHVIASRDYGFMGQLLSPKALALLLGIAEQTIYNRHSMGGDLPPALKLGRLLRFRSEDVDIWLSTQAEKSKHCPLVPIPAARRRAGRPTKAEQIAARSASQ